MPDKNGTYNEAYYYEIGNILRPSSWELEDESEQQNLSKTKHLLPVIL